MTPVEMLRELQKEANKVAKYDVPSAEDKIAKYEKYSNLLRLHGHSNEVMDMFHKQLEEAINILPTEYQELGTYNILMQLFLDLEKVIKSDVFRAELKDSIELKPIPTFGTVPLSTFSAFITPTDNASMPLIVFSEKFFIFAHLISEAVGMGFYIFNSDDNMITITAQHDSLKEHISQNPIVMARSLDLLFAYALLDDPSITKHRFNTKFPSKYNEKIAIMLHKGFELFVVAHEYAHYLLGHTGLRNIDELLHGVHSSDCEEKYVDEIAADTLGAVLSSYHFLIEDSEYKPLSFLGAYLCIHCLGMLNKINNLKLGRDEDYHFSDTHPNSEIRRMFLRESVVGNDEMTLTFFDIIDFIISQIWEEFKKIWNEGIEIYGDSFMDKSLSREMFEDVQSEIYERYI